MDIKGEKMGWDELGDLDRRIYTDTMHKMGNSREPTVPLRAPFSVLYGDINRKEIKKKHEGIHVYIQLTHFALQQKLIQGCKEIILQ